MHYQPVVVTLSEAKSLTADREMLRSAQHDDPLRILRRTVLAGVADHRGVGHTGAESAVLVQARPVNGYRFDMPLVMSASAGRPASIQTQQELAPDPGTLAPVTGVQAATGAQMQQATVPEAGTASQTDMDDLVDRVLRTLMRRLAVEGERREWQRW